jgi:CubicO group peptidase (beta-lactamase class C family)
MVYDSTFGYRYLGDPKSWDKWRDYRLVGETDDGNSYYANNGVAGHAGLFSTASDLRVLLDLLDKRGTYNGKQYVSTATIDRFLTRDNYGHYLGWQYPADMPAGTFMHTGFTGTYVMGVPKYRLSVVLLTNRQMMGTDAKGFFPDVTPLRVGVSKAIVASVAGEDKTSTIGVHFEPTDCQSGIVARSPERRLLLSLSTVGVLCSPTAVRRVQCRQRAPGATPLERRKRGLRASG